MLSRRMFLGGLSAGLPVVLVPNLAHAKIAKAPRLHAIVIGINTYTGRSGDGQPIRALKGCLNDTADIERQVQRLQPMFFRRLGWDAAAAAERPVTRADFFGAWRDMMDAAQAGDTVLLTFAGHGSRVPVLPGNPSNEVDGYDETLVLTGWDASQGRNAEHIIDDELNELFLAAHARGATVVFVADCVYAGGLVSSTAMPPSLLFLAGAHEDETMPEIRDPRTGLYRGALSIAVARALEGGAATAAGAITAGSLARFVRRHVRLLAETPPDRHIDWPTLVTQYSVARDRTLFAHPDWGSGVADR
jgi:hypothetical protein